MAENNSMSRRGTGQPALGLFEGHADVGQVEQPGFAGYNPVDQHYRITASATGSRPDHDRFHCLWKRMTGDFILHTRARFVGPKIEASAGRQLGWIVCPTLEEGSPHISAVLQGDGRASLQLRRVAGGSTEEVHSASASALAAITEADVLQLERKGNRYRMSVARFGDPFASTEVEDIELGAGVYVALFVTSHNEAHFSNVRIVVPAPDDFVPYRDLLGSHLETLDVVSGQRRIIHSAALPFEAPNWTPDGKALIYNSAGRLYRFDLASRTPQLINTGFATRNNNDHVLSFDGTMLGISHHSEEDQGNAIVYTLPSGGGTPRRVTAQGPSYLHGWSPDGKFLVYTGMRDGEADIYRTPVSGGVETRLTTAPGLDDGSEYTPDGRYIYFNSVRSGSMQIWRMLPDGSSQEQVTDDEYNNWFPHISPDGQQIVFLSYGQDVEPGDHPPYKQVYLRMTPVAGAAGVADATGRKTPRVVAYVYGGQGTINVPSWSTDSKRVAFVSYTALHEQDGPIAVSWGED
jgi:TolB protein